MYKLEKISKIAIGCGVLLILTACGGGPSEGDMLAAIAKESSGLAKAAGRPDDGAGMIPKLNSVKKIGCKEDGDNAYKCDVELEVTRMGQTGKAITSVRFVKGSDGWGVTR